MSTVLSKVTTWRCFMNYTKQEKIDIGRQVYTHELTSPDAQLKYGVSHSTIDNYVREYQLANGLPVTQRKSNSANPMKKLSSSTDLDIEKYRSMSKEELIDELILAKVNEARAKKGYEVKGDGPNKVFNFLSSKSSK